MKNIRENYTLKTFKEFVIDNYSDLFEELNKPALGKDLPKHQTLSNKIINKKFSNRTNVNNNANKPVGQGVKAVLTNVNITTPKMKLSANNKKSPLGKSISNKNESYYYTDEDFDILSELKSGNQDIANPNLKGNRKEADIKRYEKKIILNRIRNSPNALATFSDKTNRVVAAMMANSNSNKRGYYK